MTIKHIQDQIESMTRVIAYEAYALALKHKLENREVDNDELFDELNEIVKKQLGD